jgi:predicted peptidase
MLKIFVATILLSFILLDGNMVAAAQIKRLSGGEAKPRLSASEIEELSLQETKAHAVEGFVSVKSVVDCFDEMSYTYTGGRYNNEEIKFRMRSPNKIVAGKKYPLVVWFHGKGESDNENSRQLAHMQMTMEFLIGPKMLDCFIIATQCPKDNPNWFTSVSTEGKGDAPITILREIFEAVLEEFPIDEDRISVFGLSSGGSAAWQFVMDSPEKFAGLVVCSATKPPGELPTNVNIWTFANTGDGGVPIEQVRRSVEEINSNGGTALLTEMNTGGHDSWFAALGTKKVLAWMLLQKRNGILNPPPGMVLTPKRWSQVFWYLGLPLCCLLPFYVFRKRKREIAA